MKMIPDDIALEYSCQRGGDDEWKVDEIVKFLQKEVQSRERALQMTTSYTQKEQNPERKPWKQSTSFNELTNNKTRDTHSSHVWLLCPYNVMMQHSESNIGECLGQPEIEIEASETPQVCTAVMNIPGDQIQYELKKKRLRLADFPDNDDDPELSVQIGADYYWQMVSGRVERLTETLVAVESTF